MSILKLVDGATVLPVTLAEIKDHLNIEYDDKDDYIESLILAAIDQVEKDTGLSFAEETWEWHDEEFKPKMFFPINPVSSIVEIKYYDTANTLQTLSSSDYHAMLSTNGVSWIESIYSKAFPFTYYRPDAVKIKFVSGDASVINPTFNHLVKLWCGVFWEQREGQASPNMDGIDRLTKNLKAWRY